MIHYDCGSEVAVWNHVNMCSFLNGEDVENHVTAVSVKISNPKFAAVCCRNDCYMLRHGADYCPIYSMSVGL